MVPGPSGVAARAPIFMGGGKHSDATLADVSGSPRACHDMTISGSHVPETPAFQSCLGAPEYDWLAGASIGARHQMALCFAHFRAAFSVFDSVP